MPTLMQTSAAAAGLALVAATALASPPLDQAEMKLFQTLLPGHWFHVDLASGAPVRKAAGQGLDACRQALAGRGTADLSFRLRAGVWEVAYHGGPFERAEPRVQGVGDRQLTRIGSQSLKQMKFAADGTPRVFSYTGDPDDEVEASFQKCPVR